MDKLKKCPFCGGNAVKRWIPESMRVVKTVGGYRYTIMCESYLCVQLVVASTWADAIEKWNKRIQPTEDVQREGRDNSEPESVKNERIKL